MVITILRRSAVYVLSLLLADLVGVGFSSIVLYRNLFHYFTLVLLIEGGLLFLVGGAADFAGSLTYRRLMDHGKDNSGKSWSFTHYTQKQMSVAVYVVTGVILLLLSFALAYPLN